MKKEIKSSINSIKLGVIGAGYISKFHLETFRDMNDVSIVAICNRSEEKRKKIAVEFNIPHQYADYKEMLKEQKLDAILICVSVENMASVTLGCIPSKIPLLVEKPVALSVNEAEQIALLAKQHDTKIMIGCNRRFMSTIQKAKEAAHQLGGISAISVEANERIIELLQDNKVSEAVKEKWIYANGIHCIDLMRFFADADSKEVTSVSLPSQKKYNALIKFMSGITAHYFSHPDIPSKWTVILYAHQAKITLRPLELCTIEKRGEPPQEFGLDDLDRKYKPGFFQQNRHFIDCVKSKAPILWPACDIEQAVEVMRLIEKIEK